MVFPDPTGDMTTGAWPALVLAAGLGTRLRRCRRSAPKRRCRWPAAPLIVRILSQLRAPASTGVVINLHHRAETITRIVGDGARSASRCATRGRPRSSARAAARRAPYRRSPPTGSSSSTATRWRPLLRAPGEAHVGAGADVTLAVAPADLAKYNALVGDAAGSLVGIVPRGSDVGGHPTRPRLAFRRRPGGQRRGVRGRRPGSAGRFAARNLSGLAARRAGAVRVCPTEGAFYDIGTPGDYLRTARRIAAAEAAARSWARTVIAPSAQSSTRCCGTSDGGRSAVLSHCVVDRRRGDSCGRALPSRGDHGRLAACPFEPDRWWTPVFTRTSIGGS